MTGRFHRSFFIEGPTGRLEAMLWTAPTAEPAMAGLVCHPHPLYGGTMHNKVVFQVARTLNRLGLPILRFNFRGTGLSAGSHDEGRGEAADVQAALDWLANAFPSRPLVLAGFSFGAWVGLRVGCADTRVSECAGLGLPVNDSDLSYLRACLKPKLFVQGSQDQYGTKERVEELVATVPNPKRLVLVEGADHFFTGKLDQVEAALQAWMLERHPELAITGKGQRDAPL